MSGLNGRFMVLGRGHVRVCYRADPTVLHWEWYVNGYRMDYGMIRPVPDQPAAVAIAAVEQRMRQTLADLLAAVADADAGLWHEP